MPTTSTSKKPTKTQLAKEALLARFERLLAILEETRHTDSFPLTVSQLALRLAEEPSDTLKLLAQKEIKTRLFLFVAKSLESPVILIEDKPRFFQSEAFLLNAAATVRAKRTSANKPLSADPKKFVVDAKLPTAFKEIFTTAFMERIANRSLPTAVAELIEIKPPAPTAAEVAAKLLTQLASQRHAGAQAYPVPASRLLALANYKATEKTVKEALKHQQFLQQVTLCLPHPLAASAGPAYLLTADLASMFTTLVAQGIDFAIAKKGTAKRSTLFAAKEIAAFIKDAPQQLAFIQRLEHDASHGKLGNGLAWLYLDGKQLFFRRQDIEPKENATAATVASPATATVPVVPTRIDFASAFAAAFDRVDSRSGGRNFVKVGELRQELPQFTRDQFDAGLRTLRIEDRYTMESAHGGTVRLTEEEREAGIQEGSSLLVYVSRK